MLGPYADAMMTAALQDGMKAAPSGAARKDAPPALADVTPEGWSRAAARAAIDANALRPAAAPIPRRRSRSPLAALAAMIETLAAPRRAPAADPRCMG